MAMREWLYILRPVRAAMLSEGPNEPEALALTAHVEHMRHLTEAGVVILAGRTQYDDMRTMGLVILRAENEEAALRLMEADPPVLAGIMTAELHPYMVAFQSDQR